MSDTLFQCWFCEINLIDQRYIIHDGFACCLNCFEKKFALRCSQCQQIISMNMQGKIFQEKIWHETCFNCSICQRSLINDQSFAYEHEKLFCRICLIDQFAQRCSRCNRSIEPNEKCLRYENDFYHQSCFVCNTCQQTLMNNDFRRRDQSLFCRTCYLIQFGIYCIKCHQAITNDGVLYKNHPFHYQCFLCTHCSCPLRNQRYVEYDDQAYCSTCARELFQ